MVWFNDPLDTLQFQTIAEDESTSSLPLSTHSAVEMLHDSALYKSIIDIDYGLTSGLLSCTVDYTIGACLGVYLVKSRTLLT